MTYIGRCEGMRWPCVSSAGMLDGGRALDSVSLSSNGADERLLRDVTSAVPKLSKEQYERLQVAVWAAERGGKAVHARWVGGLLSPASRRLFTAILVRTCCWRPRVCARIKALAPCLSTPHQPIPTSSGCSSGDPAAANERDGAKAVDPS